MINRTPVSPRSVSSRTAGGPVNSVSWAKASTATRHQPTGALRGASAGLRGGPVPCLNFHGQFVRSSMDLRKFSPRWAVAILAEPSDWGGSAFLRPWALAQLLAWAILDQRPGKKAPKKAGKTTTRAKIRTVNARQAGQITLAYLLDRYLARVQQGSVSFDDQAVHAMLVLFLRFGGFAASLQGRSAKALLSSAQAKSERELRYVYKIVDYLCRYKAHVGDDEKFNIESAKSFIELSEGEGYGVSKISKIWEKYKNAAPYILGSYPFFRRGLQNSITPKEVMDWLEKFTSDQRRLDRLIGRVAYAADILTGKARKVRQGDFKDIRRVVPPTRRFTQDELDIISSIDRRAPIA
jgi:hypothetical protein